MALTPRGFIKDVGGVKRMRWTRAGTDATDLTLPQNQVVFDSVSPNIFGVYLSGIWTGVMDGTPTKVVSWPSPGYIPLVRFWSSPPDTPAEIWPFLHLGSNTLELMMETEATGIWLSTEDTDTVSVVLRYIVFRMPC